MASIWIEDAITELTEWLCSSATTETRCSLCRRRNYSHEFIKSRQSSNPLQFVPLFGKICCNPPASVCLGSVHGVGVKMAKDYSEMCLKCYKNG